MVPVMAPAKQRTSFPTKAQEASTMSEETVETVETVEMIESAPEVSPTEPQEATQEPQEDSLEEQELLSLLETQKAAQEAAKAAQAAIAEKRGAFLIRLDEEIEGLMARRAALQVQLKAAQEEIKSLDASLVAARQRRTALGGGRTPQASRDPLAPRNTGVKDFVKPLLEQGLSNKEIFDLCTEHFQNSSTTYATVAWYRNQFNEGKL